MAPADKDQLKTVLITGGGSGIGLATAELLLETKQYRVVLLGRERARLEEAAKKLGGSDRSDHVGVATCDVRDSAQIRKTVERVASQYKGIYGLVNNAGIYPF